jgi:hypothetical protein
MKNSEWLHTRSSFGAIKIAFKRAAFENGFITALLDIEASNVMLKRR